MGRTYMLEQSDDDIHDVLNHALSLTDDGKTRYPGLSYEHGVVAALHWVLGEVQDSPLEDDEDIEDYDG